MLKKLVYCTSFLFWNRWTNSSNKRKRRVSLFNVLAGGQRDCHAGIGCWDRDTVMTVCSGWCGPGNGQKQPKTRYLLVVLNLKKKTAGFSFLLRCAGFCGFPTFGVSFLTVLKLVVVFVLAVGFFFLHYEKKEKRRRRFQMKQPRVNRHSSTTSEPITLKPILRHGCFFLFLLLVVGCVRGRRMLLPS